MKIVEMEIEKIKPYEKNPRINAKAIDKVVNSIREFGFQQPIVVDKDRVVIVGHTRLKAAQQMCLAKVPVVYAENLTPEQTKAYRIADNKSQDFSEWDYDKLAGEFEDLKLFGYDLSMTAFNPDEINQILQKEVEEDNFDIDEALENIIVPKARVGDVFLLGNHRLFCGDATIKEAADVLMNGRLADMVFTDPPYNINYTGEYWGDKSIHKKIKNDNMSDEEFYEFLHKAFTVMHTAVKDGSGVYVCHADSEGLNFRKAMKDAGWQVRQCIIWVKNILIIGRGDHHWQHEPILYTWKEGASHRFYGGRKNSTVIKPENGIAINKIDGKKSQITLTNGLEKIVVEVEKYNVLDLTDSSGTTIWHVDKPRKAVIHPTAKPLKLCAKAIKNSSVEGDIVLDPFGGSGSTLMACEQMGRTCYTMELDPIYVDVICKRWEEHTNKKVVRVGD